MDIIQFFEDEDDQFTCGDLSEEEIRTCQEKLGFVLPDAYIKLMKLKNGFTLKKNKFQYESRTNQVSVVELDGLLGIGKDPGILDGRYLQKEWGLPKNVVVFSLTPPEFICLDYRNDNSTDDPKVIYIDVDEDKEVLLAENFESFIKGLKDEKELVSDGVEERVKTLSDYQDEIDAFLTNGNPKKINSLFLEIAETADEKTFKYIVGKMKDHSKPKVKWYLLCYLYFCASGENPELQNDKEYLHNVLNQLASDKNKDVKSMAVSSLEKLKPRMD